MVILHGKPTNDYNIIKADLKPFIIKTVTNGLTMKKKLNIDPNEIIEFAYYDLFYFAMSDKTYCIDKTMFYLRLHILKEIRSVEKWHRYNVPITDENLNGATQPSVEEMVFLMILAEEVRSTMGECNYADLLIDYYEHDMKAKDIMHKYNLTEGQYRGIRYRAKKQLLEKLKLKGIDGQ